MSGWVCPECRAGQHAHDRYPDDLTDAGCARSPDTVIECACDVVVHDGVDWRKRAEAAEAERDATIARVREVVDELERTTFTSPGSIDRLRAALGGEDA